MLFKKEGCRTSVRQLILYFSGFLPVTVNVLNIYKI